MIINENLNASTPETSSVELHEKLIGLMRCIQNKKTPERKQEKVPVDPTLLIEALKAILPESSHQDLDSFSDYLSQNPIQDKKILLAYAKLMYAVEKNGIADEHATKLETLLCDLESVFKYLNACFKAGAGSPKTLHDACLFVLPRGGYDLTVWRELSKKFLIQEEFRKYILPQADDIEALIKANQAKAKPKAEEISQAIIEIQGINGIIKNLESIRGKGEKGLNEAQKSELADKKRSKLEKQLELTAKGIHFNKDLAIGTLQAFRERFVIESSQSCALLLKNGLTKKDYAKFIALTRQNDDVKIPNVKIECSSPGLEGITISKVDVMDELQAAEAACFGKLTDCCQSLSGEAGEPCVVHGLTSPYGGFYVVKNHANEVLGQCWAWRSQSGAIVFDSIEISEKDNSKIASELLFRQLAEKLVQDKHTHKVACGARSGISKNFGVEIDMFKEAYVDYKGYSDSIEQRVLIDKTRPYLLYETGLCTKDNLCNFFDQIIKDEYPEKNASFIEMIYWSKMNKKNINELFQMRAEESKKTSKHQEILQNVTSYLDSTDHFDFLESHNHPFYLLNLADPDGYLPVMHALDNYGIDGALKLMEKGANINAKNQYDTTILIYAAITCNIEAALKLIECGANINAKDRQGNTTLIIAAHKGLTDVALKLIKMGANIDEKDLVAYYTPLITALTQRHSDLALKLIEHGADINAMDENGNTSFILAAQKGLTDVALKLIKKGANINEKNLEEDTALIIALENGHSDLALKLIEHGADINVMNKYGNTTLMLAARKGLTDVALKLIEHDANINAKIKGNPSLIDLTRKGLSEVVLKLIEVGADINDRDSGGYTSLMWAIRVHNNNLALKLIELGANINLQSKLPAFTALKWAALTENRDVALRLIEMGAKMGPIINDTDNMAMKNLEVMFSADTPELKNALLEKITELRSSPHIKKAITPMFGGAQAGQDTTEKHATNAPDATIINDDKENKIKPTNQG